jgi:hypothetical protein
MTSQTWGYTKTRRESRNLFGENMKNTSRGTNKKRSPESYSNMLAIRRVKSSESYKKTKN